MAVALGADFAAAPWVPGLAHPAAWPIWAWQSVLLKQPAGVPAGGVGGAGIDVKLAPPVWQSAQAAAFPSLVFVCVLVPPLQGAGECGAVTVAP